MLMMEREKFRPRTLNDGNLVSSRHGSYRHIVARACYITIVIDGASIYNEFRVYM